MRIIIPMTGYGSRFVSVGYKELKPFIKVQGRAILQWIVHGMYSNEDKFIFVCRKEHLKKIKDMKNFLEGLASNVEILAIDKWEKKGPVHDIMYVADMILDNEPYIVNYCDLYIDWDWKKLQDNLRERNCDGGVICWHGFNPTLLPENNVFASCRVDKEENLVEIREKHTFEEDRMQGYYSAGVYYYKSGKLLKKYFQKTIDREKMINGEYYASIPYNYMVEDGLKVWVSTACKTFCNWGTPQDLEDYLFWIRTIERMESTMNILIPMAGAGQRFVNAGYTTHKPVLPVLDRKTGKELPMVCCAVSDLPDIDRNNVNLIFIDRTFHKENGVEDEIKKFYPKATFITTENLTAGQACTCLLAKKYINDTKELLIAACDNGLVMNYEKYYKLREECDVIVFTHKGSHVLSNPNAYGWMKVDEDDNILDVSCKRAISDTPEKDNAVVATFWFREGRIFVKAAEKMIYEDDCINNEFYVDEVIKHVLELGFTAKIFQVDKYIGWGTPEDYMEYNRTIEYWKAFYHSNKYLRRC